MLTWWLGGGYDEVMAFYRGRRCPDDGAEEEFDVPPRPPLGSIPLTRIDGTVTTMAEFAGKVLLIVNTASRCAEAWQYGALQRLYERYRERGFVVLAFPSDSFRKEPDDDGVIAERLRASGVTYPVFAKTDVKGGKKHPLYCWLTDRGWQPEWGGKVSWNFDKFLVGRRGEIVGRFIASQGPEDEEVVAAVEAALAEEV